jgi:hypothetical protein
MTGELRTKSMVLMVFVILVISCSLLGCIEKSTEDIVKITENPKERTDMFTFIGYQNTNGTNLGVYHYDEGNVTLFITSDGLTAIPDYQLNRSNDYSAVQEALDLTKIKS